jgi:hypothetical protein
MDCPTEHPVDQVEFQGFDAGQLAQAVLDQGLLGGAVHLVNTELAETRVGTAGFAELHACRSGGVGAAAVGAMIMAVVVVVRRLCLGMGMGRWAVIMLMMVMVMVMVMRQQRLGMSRCAGAVVMMIVIMLIGFGVAHWSGP